MPADFMQASEVVKIPNVPPYLFVLLTTTRSVQIFQDNPWWTFKLDRLMDVSQELQEKQRASITNPLSGSKPAFKGAGTDIAWSSAPRMAQKNTNSTHSLFIVPSLQAFLTSHYRESPKAVANFQRSQILEL
mmetsp:Transcript_2327/g.15486  ORF Transcript_2327/g.15486 Transcript_2327/m.15486 type:complete len:132 (+) Transcript_2327:727-1122(+)